MSWAHLLGILMTVGVTSLGHGSLKSARAFHISSLAPKLDMLGQGCIDLIQLTFYEACHLQILHSWPLPGPLPQPVAAG